MNATTLAPTRKVAKAMPSTTDSRPAIENEAQTERNPQAGFTALANSLRYASHTDELHSHSGDSDRLLRIAADVASAASDNPPQGEDAQHRAFDIAALTVAAMRVPGDTCSAARFDVLQEVKATLQWLTDCEDVMQDSNEVPGIRPLIVAGQKGKDVAAQCTYDIEPVAEMLINLAGDLPFDGTVSPGLVRALAVRVKELNSVVMSFLTNDNTITLHDARFAIYHGADHVAEGDLQ